MTIEELVEKLKVIKAGQDAGWTDKEDDHMKADGALLDFINDDRIREAYLDINRWYA